jgi:hypothetical protein
VDGTPGIGKAEPLEKRTPMNKLVTGVRTNKTMKIPHELPFQAGCKVRQ